MKKKALLVGINDYFPVGDGGSDLRGCVNDVEDMANTLVILGYESANMRIITDSRATKEGILEGLKWLIKGAKKDDKLVFFYSGHGSRVPDFNGDELDRLDEIICPHDMDFGGNYISDDDFKELFKTIPKGVNLEAILDSCHSGTATRGFNPDNCIKNKYLNPPIDFAFHINYNPSFKTMGLLKRPQEGKERKIVEGLNHTLWAGCKDNQTSQELEINGKVRGVLSYHLCEILRRSSGNITKKAFYKLLAGAIKRGGFEQIPQLETSSEELKEKVFV